jgi:hypothetical protein
MAGIAPIAASGTSHVKKKKQWNLPYATPGLVHGLLYGGLSAGGITVVAKLAPRVKKYRTEMLQLKKELKNADSFDAQGTAALKKKIRKLQMKIFGLTVLLIGAGGLGAVSGIVAIGNFADAALAAIATACLDKCCFTNRKKQSLMSQIFAKTPFDKTIIDNDGHPALSPFHQDRLCALTVKMCRNLQRH